MLHRKDSRVRARFDPKVPEALLPKVAALAGTETYFTYARQMDEDEPYPDKWVLTADDPRFAGYVIPEIDLEIIGSSPSRRHSSEPNH